jgi:hypothetical protein
MIYAVSFKHKIPPGVLSLNVTSRSDNWGRHFSPFNLGPVDLYDGYVAKNIENAYQFSKVYQVHNDINDHPSKDYWDWAKAGWDNPAPIKYPFGAWTKHLYHWWYNKKLTNLEAQNQIFLPLYKKAVIKTPAFEKLKYFYETSNKDLYLLDYEGYDHRFLEKSWDDVINNPNWPVGQAFALCMILEGYL